MLQSRTTWVGKNHNAKYAMNTTTPMLRERDRGTFRKPRARRARNLNLHQRASSAARITRFL